MEIKKIAYQYFSNVHIYFEFSFWSFRCDCGEKCFEFAGYKIREANIVNDSHCLILPEFFILYFFIKFLMDAALVN